MVISVASPRKSIAEKVFERVGGYYHGSNSKRRCVNYFEGENGKSSYSSLCDEDGENTGMELVQIGAETTKNVLILMSDTGGGHRASAEAIRDAFQIEFGDNYRVILISWPFSFICNLFG